MFGKLTKITKKVVLALRFLFINCPVENFCLAVARRKEFTPLAVTKLGRTSLIKRALAGVNL